MPRRKVLLLHGLSSDFPWTRLVRQGLYDELAERPETQRPDLFEEHLDGSRLGAAAVGEATEQLLTRKYADVRFDLIIADVDDAALFLLQRPHLFPGVPRYFFDYSGPAPEATGEQEHFIPADVDWKATLRTIFTVLPNTRRVVVVGDRWTAHPRTRMQAIRRVATWFEANATFEYWEDFTLAELHARAAALPRDTAVLYLSVFRDRDGTPVIPAREGRELSLVASAPVFIIADPVLTPASLGGVMVSGQKTGRLMGRLVTQGLGVSRGQDQDNLRAAVSGCWLEDEQLRRWGIPDERLPPGCVVLHRPAGLLDTNPREVAVTVAVVTAQSLLIAGLIVLYRQRQRGLEELRQLTARLVATEEEERRRIARDLHDHVGQTLAALSLHLSSLPATPEGAVDRALALTQEVMKRVRHVISNLRPAALDDFGLAAALRLHIRDFGDQCGVRADFCGEADVPRLPPDAELALYRVAEEAMVNAARHARAGVIKVSLEAGDDQVRLIISDDGRGFTPGAMSAPSHGGLGLRSMRERIRAVDGTLAIRSIEGRGTTIEARVPTVHGEAS